MEKVRWGIMSTAAIGATKVIPAMQKGTHCDIQAVASLSLEKAKALAKKLKIPRTFGSLRTIQSFFSYYNTDPNNIRNMANIGGGGLMDIGCYTISLARFIFDAEP